MACADTASVSTDTLKAYRVRNGLEWATICLREWDVPMEVPVRDGRPSSTETQYCGEILIHSSCGSWAHVWSACGKPFREFLLDAEFDYVFGHFMGSSLRIFDAHATLRDLRQKVLEKRKYGEIDRNAARVAWALIGQYEQGLLSDERGHVEACLRIRDEIFREARPASDASYGQAHTKYLQEAASIFSQPWEGFARRFDPTAQRFWDKLWKPFKQALHQEIAMQRIFLEDLHAEERAMKRGDREAAWKAS